MSKNTIDAVILKLYKEDPNVVNSEPILLDRVFHEFGWNENKSLYDNLCRMPRAESVTRRRRVLHEKGEIVYSPEADKMREMAFREARDEYGKHKAVSWMHD